MFNEIKDIELIPTIEAVVSFLEDYPKTNVTKVCETFGITYYIFNKTLKLLPDLLQRYKNFKKDRDNCFAEVSKNALVKIAEGYQYEEAKTTYDSDGNIKERVVYEKLKHPDCKAACILSGSSFGSETNNNEVKETEDKTISVKKLSSEDWEKKWKNGQIPKNVKPISSKK